jgi:hypothetical protein
MTPMMGDRKAEAADLCGLYGAGRLESVVSFERRDPPALFGCGVALV